MSNRAKPTEGPLTLHRGDDYLEVRQDTRGMFRVIYTVHYPDAEDVANARLFIAAHDMAEALKHILEDALAMGMASSAFSGAVIEARAALKKAGVA